MGELALAKGFGMEPSEFGGQNGFICDDGVEKKEQQAQSQPPYQVTCSTCLGGGPPHYFEESCDPRRL